MWKQQSALKGNDLSEDNSLEVTDRMHRLSFWEREKSFHLNCCPKVCYQVLKLAYRMKKLSSPFYKKRRGWVCNRACLLICFLLFWLQYHHPSVYTWRYTWTKTIMQNGQGTSNNFIIVESESQYLHQVWICSELSKSKRRTLVGLWKLNSTEPNYLPDWLGV